MKYIKARLHEIPSRLTQAEIRMNSDEKLNRDLDIIVGEMINIETNIQYFVDGVIVSKLVPNYNTYIINNITYQIQPNTGVVIMLTTPTPQIIDVIQAKHSAMHEKIFRAFGHYPSIPTGIIGTTQYVYVTSRIDPTDKIAYHYGLNMGKKIDKVSTFNWYIYETKDITQSPLYIPYFTSVRNDDKVMSLSTIIYDKQHVYNLEHGTRSVNYPLIADYTVYNKNMYSGTICYNELVGIGKEILLNYISPDEYTAFFADESIDIVSSKIYWLAWENVAPRYVKKIQALCFTHDLSKLPFYEETEECNITMDSSSATNNYKYRCCLTGMPIYEDCYVIDIFQQQIECEIYRDEVTSAHTIINKDASLVNNSASSNSMNNVTTRARTTRGRHTNTRGRNTRRRTTINRSSVGSNAPRPSVAPAVDPLVNSVFRPMAGALNIVEKEADGDGGGDTDATDADNTLDITDNLDDDNLNENKSQVPIRERCTVLYTHVHKKPVQLLISAYAVQALKINNSSILNWLTNMKQCSYILYRTCSPVKCLEIINDIHTAPFYRGLSNWYKPILHAFNSTPILTKTEICSMYDNINYTICSAYSLSQLLNISSGTVLIILDDKNYGGKKIYD